MGAQSGGSAKGCWHAAGAVLGEAGVRDAFGLPGDDLNALPALEAADIRFTLCRDQRNAVFMATGYAIQSGELGVAVAGKGPAVTNTVTGLLEAACSAAPVLLLSGGTAVEHRGSGAFQELDQLAAIRPLVKWAARVDHPSRLVPMLRRAILVAREGAPGPVYLELPDHLLSTEIPVPPECAPGIERVRAHPADPESPALRVLRAAQRPLVLAGGGMRHRNEGRLIERFAETFGAAVACTASGRGAVDEKFPQFCGLSGLYTPEEAAELWARTDCVLALGSRLEETAVFGWPDNVGTEIPVVQVNVDAAEFATDFGGPKVLADARAVLQAWLAAERPSHDGEWARQAAEVHMRLLRNHRDKLDELRRSTSLHIVEVLEALDGVLPADRILVQENGLQDMWSYLYPRYTCSGGAGSVVPSEQTSLGFGAAAAVGVKQAAAGRPVVAFVGDGAFGMFDADLPTALAQGAGLLYVVLRNGGYGWLQSQLDGHESAPAGVSFVTEAESRVTARELPGLRQFTVTDKTALFSTVTEAWKCSAAGQVSVLNVPVRLDDAMFGAETAGGDFPVLPESG